MSDPIRPEDLFAAARSELPSAAAKAKAAAALGMTVASGAVGAASTASATSTVAGTVLKVCLALATLGGTFYGGYVAGQHDGSPPAPIVLQIQPAPTPAPPGAGPEAAPAPNPPPLPDPQPQPVRPKASPKPPPKPDTDDDSLSRELAALDRARTRVHAKDADGALAELAAYQRAFPKGELATEATLVRIEALLLAQRRSEAEAAARPLLNGLGPELMKQRVRRLLDEAR